ncbi:uncharacterized protein LY89DRAFT_780994 [Mollisia scopiformis]|uniref:Uncharacterized protein n=1 Tax=Mollisia scopiformis TaxID=149040 RepID=A0A194XCG4_MOLSC|nr:uncharacterized protein LY89DRAFT_780994 [Mollisia scopiformis]KUJ17860.1 hypothetical protein LY89DRAFT_780994 [Mollisia scopiformis]
MRLWMLQTNTTRIMHRVCVPHRALAYLLPPLYEIYRLELCIATTSTLQTTPPRSLQAIISHQLCKRHLLERCKPSHHIYSANNTSSNSTYYIVMNSFVGGGLPWEMENIDQLDAVKQSQFCGWIRSWYGGNWKTTLWVAAIMDQASAFILP